MPEQSCRQLLLKQLMEETNRHLTALSSGRYTLKPATENVLGLHIEDALQARALRSVKTLSGGESFLVSLCLALGLSDMAGQHRKIESLFLDEGFGVLDEEMLYKVMSALPASSACRMSALGTVPSSAAIAASSVTVGTFRPERIRTLRPVRPTHHRARRGSPPGRGPPARARRAGSSHRPR